MTVYVVYGIVCEKQDEDAEMYDKFVHSDILGVFDSFEKAVKFFDDWEDINRELFVDCWYPIFTRDIDNQRCVYFISTQEVA